MTVEIPPDFNSIVTKLISDGRFRDESEVVAEGLRLVSERERLREDVQAGIRQLDTGERIAAETVYANVHERLEGLNRSSEIE